MNFRILCHYEINGACNDKNCSNYHQKDYEPVVREMNNANHCTNDDDARVLKLDEMDQLLLLFAEYRGRIMKKWPVITASPTSSAVSAPLFEDFDFIFNLFWFLILED